MTTGGPGTGGTLRQDNRRSPGTLSARADLPPRVRSVLENLLEHSCNWFEPAIRRALDQVESVLFGLAERSGNSGEQQRHFESLREVKLARADMAPRFLQHVEASLAALRPANGAARAPADMQPQRSPLGLVDAAVLDEDLALQEIAGKAEVRNSLDLNALAQRLAVVAGTPTWAIDSMPLGPTQLAEAFRHALGSIDLDSAHRVLLYRQFDRAALLPIGMFYETANARLVGLRILPNLLPPSYRRNAAAQQSKPPADPEAGTPNAVDEANEHATERADAELFGTLRDLLGERRRASGAGAARPAEPQQPASREDLQSVLGAMQRGAGTPSRATNYDAEHFRNTLLVKLRRSSPQGRPLGLADEDADTIDLVGMLFDYITRDVRDGSAARALLTQLHVPVLRVALGDKTFFTRRDHPARELLNTIAETGARWMDASDADTDTELVDRMRMVVQHVGADFDGDIGVFENLLGDLGEHMRVVARRAEVVERRHIDAAKGRDRLEIARNAARSAVTRLVQDHRPAPRVRALLEHAWVDALALSALRDGTAGTEFRRRLTVASNLVRRAESARDGEAVDTEVRGELDAGLRQVGLHPDDVEGILDHLHADASTQDTQQERQVLERIDEALESKARLGGTEAAPVKTQPAPPAPMSPAETEMLQQLKRTAFGTWFDFVLNQQGETARRKLAWYSPVTGHCLFVNQRGARSEDRTLEQLARDMVRGQARVANLAAGSMIDRAWKAIMVMLKPGEPAPAGAAT
jgi:hypothetical protein